MNQFSTLGLSESLLEILGQIGFEKPTPIQEQAIPLLLSEEPCDFIGLAQTGTGKTAAFGLPLLDLIDVSDSNIQALIMAPTRELGQQTAKQLEQFARNQRGLNVVCVYGGANIATQIRQLQKPVQILVATPGRLLDLMKRRALSLDAVKYVVLDEADEMLNMGFKEDIDLILEDTPDERVTWLFSATMPSEIRRIVKKYMHDPKEVAVNTVQKTNENITHQYVTTQVKNKIPALRRFLDLQPDMRGVMFCRTRRETQQIADQLGDLGYGVEALHGELSQAQRDAVMKRFKNKSMQLLVATDVAARGIDVDDLTHVIHHTLPDQLESYTHRSGRTGRAGKKGISLAFINSRESRKIAQLEKQIKVEFEQVQVPSIEEVKTMRISSWAKGLLKAEIDPESEAILDELKGEFSGMDKEVLLKKLISRQLLELKHDGTASNLNEAEGPSRNSNPNANRYFINVGSLDGVSEEELREFLADISQISQHAFSNFSMQKNCAFFDLAKEKDKGLTDAFAGLIVDGRPIRLNRDDEGRGRPKRERGAFKGRGKQIDNRRSGGGDRGRGGYKGKSGGSSSSRSGGKKGYPKKKRY